MSTLTSQDEKLESQAQAPVFGLEAPAMFVAEAQTPSEQAAFNAWSAQLQEEIRPLAERLSRLSELSMEFRMRAAAAKLMRLEAMNAWSAPAPWEA